MPNNPAMSAHISAYIDPALKRRLERVNKKRPRLSISNLVESAVSAHLPALEAEVGIKTRQRMP